MQAGTGVRLELGWITVQFWKRGTNRVKDWVSRLEQMLVNKSSNNRKRKQAENLLRQFVDYAGDFLLFDFVQKFAAENHLGFIY
jgi:hypothetical protein